MIWYIGAGIAILGVVGMEVYGRLVRGIFRYVPGDEVFNYVDYQMVHGLNGTRSLIYHPASGILIQIAKSLSPNLPHGSVRLRVLKMRVEPPKHWRVDSARERRPGGVSRGVVYVWRWHWPSAHNGQVLLEIDCGCSLRKVNKAIKDIIAKDAMLLQEPVFYLSSERCAVGRRVRGRFEDLGDETFS